MIGIEVFHEEVHELLIRAGYDVYSDGFNPSRVEIADRGGETRFHLDRSHGGWIEVTRADRGGPERWECSVASDEVLNHYFTNMCGRNLRARMRLPGRLKFARRLEELSVSAVIADVPGFPEERDGLTIDGKLIGIFWHDSIELSQAIKAAQYCAVSIQELLNAYLSEDGGVFGLA